MMKPTTQKKEPSFWIKILSSFDNRRDGYSARKLSAFAGVIAAYGLSYKLGTPENADYLVAIWLVFSLLCLGIITAEQLLKYVKRGEGDVEIKSKTETEITVKSADPNKVDESQTEQL